MHLKDVNKIFIANVDDVKYNNNIKEGSTMQENKDACVE